MIYHLRISKRGVGTVSDDFLCEDCLDKLPASERTPTVGYNQQGYRVQLHPARSPFCTRCEDEADAARVSADFAGGGAR